MKPSFHSIPWFPRSNGWRSQPRERTFGRSASRTCALAPSPAQSAEERNSHAEHGSKIGLDRFFVGARSGARAVHHRSRPGSYAQLPSPSGPRPAQPAVAEARFRGYPFGGSRARCCRFWVANPCLMRHPQDTIPDPPLHRERHQFVHTLSAWKSGQDAPRPLRVFLTKRDAERHGNRTHAERGYEKD